MKSWNFPGRSTRDSNKGKLRGEVSEGALRGHLNWGVNEEKTSEMFFCCVIRILFMG